MRLAVQTGAIGTQQLTVMDCPRCGEVFAIEYSYDQARRRDGRNFFCPNGHTASYSIGESAEDREKRELKARAERAEREAATQRTAREWAETRAKGANIAAGKAKAAKRRLEQRIAHGVCPCCHRTFSQLVRHIKMKHPDLMQAGVPDAR